MNETSKVKKIVNASLFARTFGAIIDLIITIFIGAGIFLGFSNIAYKIPSIKAYKDHYNQSLADSGIMEMKNDLPYPYEFDNYLSYQDIFYDFYHSYFSEKKSQTYDIYWFNVHVYGQEDVLNRYNESDLNSRPSLYTVVGPTLFTYKKDSSDNILPEEFAIPVASHNLEDELTETQKKQLVNYYYVSDENVEDNPLASKYRYVYYYALSDLTSLPELQKDYDYYAFFGTTLPLVIAIFVTFLIFYFVIPMCFKNGETIGKLIMHTCLVNKLGYQYSRLQLIPRFLAPTFIIIALIFIIGLSIWSLMVVSLLLLISYGFVIFGKNNKALHDFIAGTLVVDKVASTWFKNREEEEAAEADVEAYVSQVKNNDEPINSDNIIYTNPHLKDKK